MIKLKSKSLCCGCTACYTACNRNAISMVSDTEGFLYPAIDEKKCINCNICNNVCPINNTPVANGLIEGAIVQNKDKEVLFESAAGGAFSAISHKIINNNGVVYGAKYDSGFKVIHSRADNIEEACSFRSSKYVQSDLLEVYRQVKNDLNNGFEVCFSGLPCQIAGLKNFLHKNYNNLYLVDLVCKGVSSPLVLKYYLELLEKRFGSKVKSVNFKRKTYGYHSSTMSVDFCNGKTHSEGGLTDLMMHSFRSEICLRPSCYECKFKGQDRASDLTLFDCWSYYNITNRKDDNRGHTSVLIHTSKGKELLESCFDDLIIEYVSANKLISYDGIMVNGCAKKPINRNEFMQILYEKGLSEAVDKCIPISKKYIIYEKSKAVLYKLHLLDFIKKLKQNRDY